MTTPDVTTSDITPGDGGEWASLAPYGYSKYEIDRRGGYGRDQQPVRNRATGNLLSVGEGTQKRNTHRRGYLQVKLYNDEGGRDTRTVHSLVLLVNVGPPAEGMQTRHLDNDPWNNRWEPGDEGQTRKAGGNLIYGSAPQQHKDQVKAGTVAKPVFECVNHATCGNTAPFRNARCVPCLTETGVRASALLSEGVPLPKVTRKVGYQPASDRQVHALARDFGGYRGTIAQARGQRREPLLRRVIARFQRGGHR